MALPSSLSSLTLREAITDSLYRAVTGLDTADSALFDSAFTQDASLDLNGHIFTGLSGIRNGCYDLISKLDTTHLVTNVRVDVKDEDSTAVMSAIVLSQHYRPGQGMESGTTYMMAGSVYNLNCIKD